MPSSLCVDGISVIIPFFKRLSPVFSNLVLARKQQAVCACEFVKKETFYGLCPNPQPFKKG